MRRALLRPAFLPLTFLALTGLFAGPVGSQDTPREAELAAIREEIRQLKDQLSTTRGRETTLESQLASLNLELELQEIQLTEASTAFELAVTRVAETETEIERLTTALAKIREDLMRRLGGLYRLGRQGYLRLFLSLEPDTDLLPAIRQLRFLVRRDQVTLERYTATRDTLAARSQQLIREQEEMDLWRQREKERRDSLVGVRKRRQRMLERVAKERRRLVARAQELQDKERKLARLINSLLDKRLTPLTGSPIQEFRGALDWPVRGEVISEFGTRLDPRYRTEVPHNGIDLVTETGLEIRAIYPGEVLYSSEFEGYGPMVVVHHPGRVFTLYAGLGELRVAKGDMLSLGGVVGTATAILYFEIRLENQPQNPREWLR